MAFVVSEGSLRSLNRLSFPVTAPQAGGGVWLSENLTREYGMIYARQPNVRTVVSAIARNIAQLGLHTYRRVNDTDRERLTDHALAKLLGRPNSWTTKYRFVERIVSDHAIYDDAFVVKVRTKEQPLSLVPVPPTRMSPLGDNWITAEGWRLHGPNGYRDLPADQVIHFQGYNPIDTKTGLSPMETLRELLVEEYEAGRWRQQMWRNGARLGGVIERPIEAPKWGEPARNRFKNDWRELYTGDGAGAGGTPILEEGMVYKQTGMDPKAAQYVEARKLSREEVAAAYHIPLPMVGILENATYSNITEQHKMLYQDTLGPWLTMIQEEFGLQLLPDLDDTDDVYVEFNIAEKLRGSFEEQATAMSTSVGAPWLTRNEARGRLNLPSVEGGDELITPLNVLEGGQASPRDSAPDENPPEIESAAAGRARVKSVSTPIVASSVVDHVAGELTGFYKRQGNAVVSRLGAKSWKGSRKALVDDVFDADRWDRELSDLVLSLHLRISTEAGQKTAAELSGAVPYDEDRTIAYLTAMSAGIAAAMNASTRGKIIKALGEDDSTAAVRHLFAVLEDTGAKMRAQSIATGAASWGAKEAGQQLAFETEAEVRKTWVTGTNPRPSHVRMNGQTVDIENEFSNGAKYPGDPTLPDEERAHCNCSLIIEAEETA